MFYTFSQNNSGGSFDFDEQAGIAHYVIIEAASKDEAINRATQIGLYFDGTDTGEDCPCCGDRWSRYCDENAEPMIYDTPADQHEDWWMDVPAFIHYEDGRLTPAGRKRARA